MDYDWREEFHKKIDAIIDDAIENGHVKVKVLEVRDDNAIKRLVEIVSLEMIFQTSDTFVAALGTLELIKGEMIDGIEQVEDDDGLYSEKDKPVR